MKRWIKPIVVILLVAMAVMAGLSFVDMRYMYVALGIFVVFVFLTSYHW